MRKIFTFIVFVCMLFSFTSGVFSLTDEEERYYTAKRAFSDDFFEASQVLFERFIKDFPKSRKVFQAQFFIGKCQFFKGQYQEALSTFNSLLRERGARRFRDEIYYWLAEVNIQGRNFGVALDYTQKIIKEYPDSDLKWWAYYLAGVSALELSRPDAAEFFNAAIEGSPDRKLIENIYTKLSGFYFREKNYAKLIKLAEKYVAVFPKGNLAAKMYFYLGEGFSVRGDIKKSIQNYKRALATSNDANLNDLVYRGMAFVLLREDKFKEAKEYIDEIQSAELKLFSEGVYYFTIKDYRKSLENLDAFLEEFPKSSFISTVYLNRAEALYEMGRVNDSLGVYTYILDNFIQDLDILDKAHYGLAWCYLKKGEYKKAIAEFKETLKYTDNPVVKISSQMQIADANQEAGNYDSALEIYEEILKNYPNTMYADYIQFQIGLIFLKTMELENALLAFENLRRNFPSSRLIPEAQYYLAVGYFSQEDYSEAKSLLEEFSKLYPREELTDDAKYLYGKCFFNEGQYQKALDIFEEVAKSSKDKKIKELLFIDMGNAYLNLSKPQEAKDIWGQFLKQFPNSQYAKSVALYLGGLYEKEKNYAEAENYYSKAKQYQGVSPQSGEALLSLAHLYWRKGDYDEAEKYFKQAAKVESPIALKAKLYLAKLYAQQGKVDEALDIYDDLIESDSAISKAAMLEKAYLLKEMNNYAAAIVALQEVIESGVDSAKVRFYLALCLEKSARYDESIDEYFNVVYRFSPTKGSEDWSIKSYFHIAKIYEKQGKTEAAKDIYEKIVQMGVDESKIAKEKLEGLSKN